MIEDFSSVSEEIRRHLDVQDGDKIIVRTKGDTKHCGELQCVSETLGALVLSSPSVVIPWDSVDYIQKYVKSRPAQVRSGSVLPRVSMGR